MTAKLASVETLYPSNFRDPVTTLREIASQIERGEIRNVNQIAIATLGDTLEVFGAGEGADSPSIALLFSAAALRFAKAVEEAN